MPSRSRKPTTTATTTHEGVSANPPEESVGLDNSFVASLLDLEAPRPSEKRRLSLDDTRTEIGSVMGQITEAIDGLQLRRSPLAGGEEQGPMTTDDAVCAQSAGMTLAKLEEMGFEAELREGSGHVFVVVQSAEGEVLVDPTMSQFFEDEVGGEAGDTDAAMKSRGGFVGTQAELLDLIEQNVEEWEPSYTYDPDRALRDVEDDPTLSDEAKAAYREEVFISATELFSESQGADSRPLTSTAMQFYEGYQRFKEGDDTGLENPHAEEAYSILRDGSRQGEGST